MNAIETLISVLCDPEGKCCISGSDDDRRLIDSAIAELAQAAQAADSVQEDAALWHWLAEYLVGTRTDLDDEIIASATVDELRKLVDADLAARAPADSVTAPAPPPECETEAEKRAFAFGWFKALESERMKADNKKKGPL